MKIKINDKVRSKEFPLLKGKVKEIIPDNIAKGKDLYVLENGMGSYWESEIELLYTCEKCGREFYSDDPDDVCDIETLDEQLVCPECCGQHNPGELLDVMGECMRPGCDDYK